MDRLGREDRLEREENIGWKERIGLGVEDRLGGLGGRRGEKRIGRRR